MTPAHTWRRILMMGACLCAAGWFSGCGRGPEVDMERAEQLAEAARLEVSIFNYNRAYDYYAQARPRAKLGTDLWKEATFGMATAGWHRLPPNRATIAEARQLFEELVEQVPEDSRYLPRALLNLGRITELRNFPGDPVEPEVARVYYERVLATWPDTIYADEAAGRLAANALHYFEDAARVRAGLEGLESYLRERPESPIASVLWYFLGDKYWTFLEDAERSLIAFEEAVEIGLVEQARAWQTFWRMAWLAEELEDPLRAAHYYARIVRETPRSPRVYEARNAYRALQAEFPGELPDLEESEYMQMLEEL